MSTDFFKKRVGQATGMGQHSQRRTKASRLMRQRPKHQLKSHNKKWGKPLSRWALRPIKALQTVYCTCGCKTEQVLHNSTQVSSREVPKKVSQKIVASCKQQQEQFNLRPHHETGTFIKSHKERDIFLTEKRPYSKEVLERIAALRGNPPSSPVTKNQENPLQQKKGFRHQDQRLLASSCRQRTFERNLTKECHSWRKHLLLLSENLPLQQSSKWCNFCSILSGKTPERQQQSTGSTRTLLGVQALPFLSTSPKNLVVPSTIW